ncbi:carbohydrate ABC transporter permease [Nonomuraea africana]|uniref:ABC-type glycerol-3-phosphate transport system permease component n=1 Tax=Nonomuraea africana TaxID=46171 RepID=A0ABR9KNY9_9ACTN|nr:carbohydrate ABC transporter permease [Nonomuraea africana]MBE1563739.1 ABC-type glycerol-3-phosphate transport system permease component [Nonomuraea africana]
MRPPWMERPTIAGRTLKFLVLTAITVAVLYPFGLALGTSLMGRAESIANGGAYVLFPSKPTFEAYAVILSGGAVTRSVLISIGITLAGTALSLVCTVFLGYALSRRGMLGGKPILLMVLATFLFTPGMIPSYLMVKELGMIDTYQALIAPVLVNAFNVVVVRAFFQNLPDELFEAAKMDGCSEWRMLWRIAIPLSKAVIAVVGLFYAVSYWNTFFNAILYLNDQSMHPIQVVLRQFIFRGGAASGMDVAIVRDLPASSIQMAVLVIALVPILLVYPFLQKYFTKGVLTGAIKG